MHEIHIKTLLKIYLKSMEGKWTINYMTFIIYWVIKGLRDGRDSNYSLGTFVVVQIPGMHFFEKSLTNLMQVRH